MEHDPGDSGRTVSRRTIFPGAIDISMSDIKIFFRKTPVKVISSVVLFLVFAGIFSWLIIYPYEQIYAVSNNYDTVFLGASESEWGINPIIIDELTGSNSYLLACSGCTLEGRLEMLKSAVKQDSLKTVFVEISYSALNKKMSKFILEKRILYFSRIGDFESRLDCCFRNFSFWDDEHDRVYAEMIYEGLGAWEAILLNKEESPYLNKGYDAQENYLESWSAKDIAKKYNTDPVSAKYRSANITAVKNIIELCLAHDIDVVVITMPLSEQELWIYENMDLFREKMLEILSDYDIPYYDFNLLKNRQDYLSDEYSYRDSEHLCDVGAKSMSKILSEIINDRKNGEEIPFAFYDSYEEAKTHSVYAQR